MDGRQCFHIHISKTFVIFFSYTTWLGMVVIDLLANLNMNEYQRNAYAEYIFVRIFIHGRKSVGIKEDRVSRRRFGRRVVFRAELDEPDALCGPAIISRFG